MKSRRSLLLMYVLVLIPACARESVKTATNLHESIPLPVYAASWETIRSERWGFELRAPDITFVMGNASAECDDSTYEGVTEPPSNELPAGIGLDISFTRTVFGNGEAEIYGWRRPTEYNPEYNPGWDVYGEGPSGAELLEGNGWFGLGGEPLVKIFLDESSCIEMMGLDSTGIDSARAEFGEITCGSAHDNRPRYMAVVRRPADGCYLVMSRTDGQPVGDIAETLRFIQDGKLVAPVGMQPPRPFSFRTHVGIAARSGPSSACVILRDAFAKPGTPLTMILLALEQEVPSLGVIGEPDPDGCGPAPAGHSDGRDTTRWYSYRVWTADASYGEPIARDGPLIVLVGSYLNQRQLDSLRTQPWQPNRATPLLIDVDRDGQGEAFAQQARGDSVVLTISRGSTPGAPVIWRAALPRSSGNDPNEYTMPPARTAPSPPATVTGRVERGRNGEVCLTIANPRVPLLQPVDVSTAGGAAAVAHVAWRPLGGCSATQRPGEYGYGLMLLDTAALAIGATATGTLR